MECNKPVDNLSDEQQKSDSDEIPKNLDSSLTALTLDEVHSENNLLDKVELKKQVTLPSSSTIISKKLISVPLRNLPAINVPEKILLCLDTCTVPEFTAFKIGDGSTYSPLYMLKRIIEIFVQNKSFMDSRHEFALLTLNNKDVKWNREFTNNPSDIINALNEISECKQDDEFRLSKLLDSVWQNVTIPKPINITIPPPYIVRLIILYNRSVCSPVIRKNYEELLGSPYFTVDVLLSHEETPVEKCQEIFNCLQEIDEKSNSYKFEVGRNVTMLHDCMAKLLSHPLQRPRQDIAKYDVNPENQKNKLGKEETI